VTSTGTAVVILGAYAHDAPAPWLVPDWWREPIVLPIDPS
jgi:hypothetical protein